MLYSIVFAALVVATSAVPSKDYTVAFGAWKSKHGKAYSDADAEAQAFSAFAHNDEKIVKHNAKGLSYTLGHNEFSDLTSAQFFAYKLGFNSSAYNQRTFSTNPKHVVKDVKLADAVDWVTSGAVTAVKNQGSCGSCWSFSTTGAIEGAYQIATGTLKSLSEQELVSCDTVDSGCNGGLMDNAFNWVKSNGGLPTEDSYPYTGTKGTCDTSPTKVVTITGYTDVTSGDEDALKSAVSQQPVSIAIEADKSVFQLYSGGVLDSSSCGTNLDHGVLLVGYGTDSGKDYWKVKNSWGSSWGESGYIRMVRGSNQCGIASQPSYPTGAKDATSVEAF